MVTATLFLALTSATLMGSVAAAGTACHADNCARAATGNFDGRRSMRLASCSSYAACTVTKATSTSTVTVTDPPSQAPTAFQTVTTTAAAVTGGSGGGDGGEAEVARRQDGWPDDWPDYDTTYCPFYVPTFAAGACYTYIDYESACSCAGITRSYSIVSGATVTRTVHVIQTPSS